MPVVNLNCRKCGKQTTEYAENRWRCLHCGAKYKYEKPQPLNAVPSVTINKTGRRSVADVLFQAEGVEVTPSVIIYPAASMTIPISTITAIQENEIIDVAHKSVSDRRAVGRVAAIVGCIFIFSLVLLCLEVDKPGVEVWFKGFLPVASIISLLFIPFLLQWRFPPQEVEEKRSFFEMIYLSSSQEPLSIRFSERRLANGFNRAVNTAIAAHV